jgi:radical SAM superfamily enzyme YgiQ (UPF0313 family)
MKALLVYPKYPDETFWGFKYAVGFVGKKAAHSPLGLPTVAAMLPADWEIKLVDMNIRKLSDSQIENSDYVFISAMSAQNQSAREVIERCKRLGVKTVAGGPLFTSTPDAFDDVDHLVLNEAEITLPLFLGDIQSGKAKHLYASDEDKWADITKTPVPRYDLIEMKNYVSMNVQYSRGCPRDCEFCDITVLYGRIPRTKESGQIVAELEELYKLGWRGAVFVVDDNFIGNKAKLKKEVLPAFIKWSESRGHPFTFFTEADIALADDEELLRLMVRAGFNSVFIGIESPNEESLEECNKIQNRNRDLQKCIRKIQHSGLEVQGGFIVGFDKDPETIFETMKNFIQESGIVTAMVGLLNALPRTKLYRRLERENRLISASTGNNTDFSINFIPKMDREILINGYRRLVNVLYSPKTTTEGLNIFYRSLILPHQNCFVFGQTGSRRELSLCSDSAY